MNCRSPILVLLFLTLKLSITIKNLVLSTESEQIIDFANSLVFGPGLRPDFNLPIRYFFVQLVDNEGKKYVSCFIFNLKNILGKFQHIEFTRYRFVCKTEKSQS